MLINLRMVKPICGRIFHYCTLHTTDKNMYSLLVLPVSCLHLCVAVPSDTSWLVGWYQHQSTWHLVTHTSACLTSVDESISVAGTPRRQIPLTSTIGQQYRWWQVEGPTSLTWVLNHDAGLVFLTSQRLCLVRGEGKVLAWGKILTGSSWDRTHNPSTGGQHHTHVPLKINTSKTENRSMMENLMQ
jgi:hypothetical protein